MRLTMWKSGRFSLASEGDDGSSSFLWVDPSGGVTTDVAGTDGVRHRTFVTAAERGVAVSVALPAEPAGPAPVYDAELRGALDGPWKAGVPIDKVLPSGAHVHIDRDGDGTGHFWEHGTRTRVVDADGFETPAVDWTRVFHPYGDAQHGGDRRQRESSEWGTKTLSNGDRITFSGLKVTTRDDAGGERTVWERGEYNPRTGEQSRGVTVDNPDGTHSTTWSDTGPGSSWRVVTETTDRNGDGTRHESHGHGDTVDGESDEDVHGGTDGDEDPNDPATQPAGDGEGATEGDPDGVPFDAVTLRELIGDAWRDQDGLDTLGDVEARLRPFLARIRAAAAAAGGGATPGELLDSLGAPPDVFFDLTGVGHDATEELDDLGRPHPFFETDLAASVVTAAQVEVTGSAVADLSAAVALDALYGVAERLTLTASAVAAPSRIARPTL
ncbi:hypothetical protein [Modestobacter sp. NPDC049651]|uniref:hypothetical protein n=1 Tax=unclassified Modestobacter TaxID=2643866 RepID=UPI0033E41270